MVEHTLEHLETQHPGGWKDIIDYVNAHYDRYQATYKVVEGEVEKISRYHNDGTVTFDRTHTGKETEEALPRLEQIRHGISGVCAARGWAVLKALDLPIPGHKDWLKPCSKWRTDEKGK